MTLNSPIENTENKTKIFLASQIYHCILPWIPQAFGVRP